MTEVGHLGKFYRSSAHRAHCEHQWILHGPPWLARSYDPTDDGPEVDVIKNVRATHEPDGLQHESVEQRNFRTVLFVLGAFSIENFDEYREKSETDSDQH
jgi:hypothetical protein